MEHRVSGDGPPKSLVHIFHVFPFYKWFLFWWVLVIKINSKFNKPRYFAHHKTHRLQVDQSHMTAVNLAIGEAPFIWSLSNQRGEPSKPHHFFCSSALSLVSSQPECSCAKRSQHWIRRHPPLQAPPSVRDLRDSLLSAWVAPNGAIATEIVFVDVFLMFVVLGLKDGDAMASRDSLYHWCSLKIGWKRSRLSRLQRKIRCCLIRDLAPNHPHLGRARCSWSTPRQIFHDIWAPCVLFHLLVGVVWIILQ